MELGSIFTSRYDTNRIKFLSKIIGKHVWFDMNLFRHESIPSPFWDGRLEHGTAESCIDVTGHVEKTYDMIGLIDCLLGDG